ncbi:MAG TPA: alpha/beta fold hydrolase [Blastocatellia bacterium]|nr:alpha/beta fold hydrolase [Blastocatellia bacterium]
MSVNQFEPQGATDTVAVFLHGFASSQAGEKAIYLREKLLAARIAFVTFDFRGHGESEGAMSDLTVTGLIEDCSRVVEPLRGRYGRIALIGSSMGACVAAWYATLNPGIVAENILIAPAFNFVDTLVKGIGPTGADTWRKRGFVDFVNEYCRVRLSYDLVRDWENYPVSQLTATYSTPTLIIHGTEDETVNYRDSLDFIARAGYPDIVLTLIKGGDHRLTAHKDRLADWAEMRLRRVRRP